MSIIKIKKKNRYVVIENKLARNRKLTLKAKGLMLYLLSLPADKEITVKELEKHTIEGKDALHNAVRELITEGYIDKRRYRDKKGLFQTEYTVYEQPQEFNRGGLSDTDKPMRINRSGSSETDNPHFRSKERIINKEEKKSSSSEYIKEKLNDIGIPLEEIEKIFKKIDEDEDKISILRDKIDLIMKLLREEKINNPTAYTITAIRNLNFSQKDIKGAIKTEKRLLRAKQKKSMIEHRKNEQKNYEEDIRRRKQESSRMQKVVQDFTSKLKKKKTMRG